MSDYSLMDDEQLKRHRDYNREYMREYRAIRRKLQICLDCGAAGVKSRCSGCASRARVRNLIWRQSQQERT